MWMPTCGARPWVCWAASIFQLQRRSVPSRGLWKIDMRTKESLPALRRILKSQPREGRGEAVCDVIYHIGPAAAALAPDVVELMAIPDADLQWAASDALGALGVSDPVVVNAL